MADKIEDGGLAFPGKRMEPNPLINAGGFGEPKFVEADHPGLTIRDWFAGQSLLSCSSFWSDAATRRTYAKRAYQMADALIKARKGEL